MARITVEDCLKKIDNQFDLVMTAAKRARRLANGAEALVELENDKPTVVALREIAEGLINDEILTQMEEEAVDDILSSEEAEELLANTPIPGQEASRPAALAQPPLQAPAAAKPVPTAADKAKDDLLADAIAAEIAAETQAAPAEDAPAADVSNDDLAAAIAAELAATPAAEAPAEPAADEPAAEDGEEKPSA